LKEAIDIYGKFLIAIFSFVAPAMTLLIGLFGGNISKYRAINEEMSVQLEDFIMNVRPGDMPGDDNKDKIKSFKKNLKENEDQQKAASKDSRLLSAKRQVRRIFIPLLISVICLMIYHLINPNDILFPILTTGNLFLTISILLLSYALFAVWQVFCMIIQVKEKMEKESKFVAKAEKTLTNEIQPQI
jgi:hypothetical protein